MMTHKRKTSFINTAVILHFLSARQAEIAKKKKRLK